MSRTRIVNENSPYELRGDAENCVRFAQVSALIDQAQIHQTSAVGRACGLGVLFPELLRGNAIGTLAQITGRWRSSASRFALRPADQQARDVNREGTPSDCVTSVPFGKAGPETADRVAAIVLIIDRQICDGVA